MHDRPAPLIEVQPDPETLATAVAGELLNRIADAQAAGRVPHIGLTGGTIADAVHSQIARMSAGSGVDWGAVHFWFGDERFLPAGSPDRNAGQARGAFLDAVGASRVHEVPAADQVPDAETAAASYSDVVRADGEGAFDVLMLGIGPDGHVASLFPGHPALDVTGAIAIAVHDSPKPPPERVTLTFEALVPDSWDCPKCGLPASLDSDNPPPAPRIEPYKTHLAYVKERRSDKEAEVILDEAIQLLRSRRKSGEIIF